MNKDLIFSSLRAMHHEFWNTAVIMCHAEPPFGKWNVAQHVQHINKTVGGIARFLQTDRSILTEKFGVSDKPSRSFEEVEAVFGQYFSSPRISPPKFVPDGVEAVVLTDEIKKGEALLISIRDALANWSEEDLDRQNCPHPLAGSFTLREMLFFSIIHADHHHKSIRLLETV